MPTAVRNPQDALLPRDSTSLSTGAAISITVHAVLLAALAGVVQWRTQSQAVVAAELWAAVPERAAPPAPLPAPAPPPAPAPAPEPAPPPAATAPRPPDIATEQERARQRERERQEQAQRERQERAERERRVQAEREQRAQRERRERTEREAQEAQARTEAARQEALRRIMSQAAGTTGTTAGATGSRDAAPSASYVARLAALIRSNAVFSGDVPGNPAAEVEVRTGAGGTIISRRLVKSSGHPAWDDAVLKAIDRTGRLPPDTDGRVPAALLIAFRPKE